MNISLQRYSYKIGFINDYLYDVYSKAIEIVKANDE